MFSEMDSSVLFGCYMTSLSTLFKIWCANTAQIKAPLMLHSRAPQTVPFPELGSGSSDLVLHVGAQRV